MGKNKFGAYNLTSPYAVGTCTQYHDSINNMPELCKSDERELSGQNDNDQMFSCILRDFYIRHLGPFANRNSPTILRQIAQKDYVTKDVSSDPWSVTQERLRGVMKWQETASCITDDVKTESLQLFSVSPSPVVNSSHFILPPH